MIKAINGLLEWFTFFLQVGFPFFNLFLFAFTLYCSGDEIIYRLSKASEGFYRCKCQDITVFHLGDPRNFRDEFNCSQAALLSYLTNNFEALINGTRDGNASFITKVFDYKVNDTDLPFFDCNAYDKILRHDNISFNIAKLVKLVEDDTERIFNESEEICKYFPDNILY